MYLSYQTDDKTVSHTIYKKTFGGKHRLYLMDLWYLDCMPMHIIHELWGEKLVCKLQLVGREMKARLSQVQGMTMRRCFCEF